MTSFEQAFGDTERAAASTLKSATDLAKVARQLHKAAQDGNIGSIKRAAASLTNSLDALRQEVANATGTWPFDDEAEEQYLKDQYAAELSSAATEKGLRIYESDGRLISYPSVIRVLPGEKAIRIDKKKVFAIRPSHLVSILLDNQKKGPRFSQGVFLEALYNAYRFLSEDQRSGRLIDDRQVGSVVPLAKIYEVFTSLPGSNREYDQTDFARDLYFLDEGEIRQTRSGARVTFPASTGTRSARGTFSFVGPDGHVITYYGIQFSGGA
ncbi:MAG: hypothetical protein IH919_10765 [Deltaproteobacteria bacterium]|nr:hypothetical protein [Deltaproteobacteria bacterium]